jgi:hypothetical protein
MSSELNVESGAVDFVIGVAGEWPPNAVRKFAGTYLTEKEEVGVHLRGHPDGHLELVLEQNGDTVSRFESCPISLKQGENILLIAEWREGEAWLSIADSRLPSLDEGFEEPYRDFDTLEEGDRISSLDHPEAVQKCKKWITRRSDGEFWKDISKDNIKYTQRVKKTNEQRGDLERSVEILSEDLSKVRSGKKERIDVLLPALRALLCWEYNDPLLLRMANLENLPLPIFTSVPIDFSEDALPDPAREYRGLRISLRRETPNQLLIDLQEWLDQPMLKDRESGTPIKNRKVIQEFASTSSLAHYHQYTRRQVKVSRGAYQSDTDILSAYVTQISGVVVGLGRYVLSEI